MDTKDYNELLSIEASCVLLLDRTRKLITHVRDTNEGTKKPRKKKGLTEEQKASILGNHRKRFLR